MIEFCGVVISHLISLVMSFATVVLAIATIYLSRATRKGLIELNMPQLCLDWRKSEIMAVFTDIEFVNYGGTIAVIEKVKIGSAATEESVELKEDVTKENYICAPGKPISVCVNKLDTLFIKVEVIYRDLFQNRYQLIGEINLVGYGPSKKMKNQILRL